MPGKIKSGKQFRLMEAAAHGDAIGGPSKEVAEKLLSHESHATKSRLAKESRFSKAMRKRKHG